jgi:hypothetical protein
VKFVAIAFWKGRKKRWRIYTLSDDGRRGTIGGDWNEAEFINYSLAREAIEYLETKQHGTFAEWKCKVKARRKPYTLQSRLN